MEPVNSMVSPVVAYTPDSNADARSRSQNLDKPSESAKDVGNVDAKVQVAQTDGDTNLLKERVAYEVNKKSGELVLKPVSLSINEHLNADTQKAIDFKGDIAGNANGLLLNKAV